MKFHYRDGGRVSKIRTVMASEWASHEVMALEKAAV
jgi:hypothetical protein